MKTNLIALTVLLLTCYSGFSQNISGTFNSDFNELTIHQNGSSVTGTYKHRNGRIEGTVSGHTLTGWWYQDNGKGKMFFDFNSDFSAFTGKWGNSEAVPSGKWNGTRISGQVTSTAATGGHTDELRNSVLTNGIFTSDFNELTFIQNGNKITGTYKYQNGRIEGILNDRTVTGFWYQTNGKGKMIFEFNSGFSEFTGKWSAGDAEPNRQWNGKRIGALQTSPPTQQANVPIAKPSAPKVTSDLPAVKSVTLNADLNSSDAVAGDLKQNSVQLNVSKGTFDQQVKLQVKESENAAPFDPKRASLIGTPLDITIDQKTKRFDKPAIVKLKLDQAEIAAIKRPLDLWVGYFNGKSWDYFPPLEVNIKEGYVKFETYHFCVFSKAELAKMEQIKYFSHKNAVNQWAANDNNALTKAATEQMVSEILSKKMGLDNKSLTQDIVETMMKENDYTSLMVSYNDGKMEEFSQNMALLAGKVICEVVTSDNNAKALLGKVTEHSSKIGAGINIATALANGDGETAAKELSREIINTFPLTKLLSTTAELTEQQINRWKSQELEAAYQVYLKGAESIIPWWGYQVEAGNFDEVWKQMRGLQTKILDDEIKNYAASKNMNANQLSSVVLAKIRKDTEEKFRQQFLNRREQESKVEAIKDQNIKLITIFETANLLSYDRYGYKDNTNFDDRLERLFWIKDMILKDTKSRLGFTGVDEGGVISAQTVSRLIQLLCSADGKEKYRKELIRLGYKKEDKKIFAKPGENKGYWQLVETINYDGKEGLDNTNKGGVYYVIGNSSPGSYNYDWKYLGKTDTYYNPPVLNGEGCSIICTISTPPNVMQPGEVITLNLSLSFGAQNLSYFTSNASASVDFDKPETKPGFSTGANRGFVNSAGKSSFKIDTYKTVKVYSIDEKVSATVPTGVKDSRIALRTIFFPGVKMGTSYIYQWKSKN